MNQGRIWCVVNPTIGLPLFLGSVAVTSLLVHGAIMMNTTWYSAYYNGNAKEKAAMATPANGPVAKAAGYSVTITPTVEKGAIAPAAFTVTVAPGAAPVVRAAAPPTNPSVVPIHTANAG